MPTLEITTTVGCPLRCTFCPQDALLGSYGAEDERQMSLRTFAEILRRVPSHVRIDFSGMSEPWANRHATEFLRATLLDDRVVGVYTTMVGMRDPRVVTSLLSEHRDRVEVLVVHLPDGENNMRGFRWSPEYHEAMLAFVELAQSGAITNYHMMTMSDSGTLHPDLAQYGVSGLGPWSPNSRGGSVSRVAVPRHETPVSCSFTPHYDQNVVLPNGDVVLCCMDYSRQHVIGNLLRDHYYDLFKSPSMSSLRSENAKLGYSEHSVCRRCERATRWEQHYARQFWEVAR